MARSSVVPPPVSWTRTAAGLSQVRKSTVFGPAVQKVAARIFSPVCRSAWTSAVFARTTTGGRAAKLAVWAAEAVGRSA